MNFESKNAQIEAQISLEAASYLISVDKVLSTALPNIASQAAFNTKNQLYHLFKSIAKIR